MNSLPRISQESLALAKQVLLAGGRLGHPLGWDLKKDITTGTGLVWYDLQAPAKSLFPVITPLRNRTPRAPGRGGTATHWKAITAINTTNVLPWVPEGFRNNRVTTTEVDKLATYRGFGLEDSVTFEAQYAAVNFEDIRARAAMNLLWAVMIREEIGLLGGNTGVALGQPSAPTVTSSNSGGSLASNTYTVYVVALTQEGFNTLVLTGTAQGPIATYVVTDPGTLSTQTVNGGGSQASTGTAGSAITGPSGSLACSVPVVNGAVAYAWFVSSAGTTATAYYSGVSTINSIVIKVQGLSTYAAASSWASDLSQNALAFDGFLSQAFGTSSGAYIASQATGTAGTGTPLTSDSAGGITEIETMLKSFYDNSKLGPDYIYVNSQQAYDINKKVIAGGGTPLFRFVEEAGDPGITAGVRVRNYLNRYTGQEIPIEVHPFLANGTILAITDTLPYPNTNVPQVNVVETRQEYYQLEWPLRTRKYELGVYGDEVLICYFLAGLGIINNVAAG